MIVHIIVALLSLIAGCTISHLILLPKLKAHKQYNQHIENENNRLIDENLHLINQNQDLKLEYQALNSQKNNMMNSIQDLQTILKDAEIQAKNAADKFYKQHLETATEKLNHSLENEAAMYQNSIQQYQNEMEEIKSAMAGELHQFIESNTQVKAQLESKMNYLQSQVDAAVAAAKRAEELKQQVNFYRIQLSETDIKEIEMLREVIPYLRDKESLNKIIWKVFYEKPTSDLIGRVVGSGTHTGIYKITNIDNQMCYIGQAANIADRWKQHIKRGIGADAPTRNKLYPAMIEFGPENFTFEVIEECERSRLDEREDYWQEYFKAKEFGYSIK